MTPADPALPDVVLVGGVPGAGKTTALRALGQVCRQVDVLDPETLRDGLRVMLPPRTPYRRYRAVVHAGHGLRVLAALLAGPAAGRTLLVHDPATRPRRRAWFARLARARGWTPALVYVDVSHADARRGQLERGRVVNRESFEGHWARWDRLRSSLATGRRLPDADDWQQVRVVDRDTALGVLHELTTPAGPQAERLVTGVPA